MFWLYSADFDLRETELRILCDENAWLTTSIIDWSLRMAISTYLARPDRRKV